MSRDMAADPWLTIPLAAEHTGTSEYEIRRAMKRADGDAEHLPARLHKGKLKARLSDVDAWVLRTSTPA